MNAQRRRGRFPFVASAFVMRLWISVVIATLSLSLPLEDTYAQQVTVPAEDAHVSWGPPVPTAENSVGTASTAPTRGVTVNLSSRQESQSFFNAVYLASEEASMDWSGAHATCNAGDTSVYYRAAILRRINYFRAIAGVPASVELSAAYNAAAQEAALMMSVNKKLDHTPPPEWTCYTAAGADAASHSNLYASGGNANPIDVYMQDPGDGNLEVGHRRWILYPNTQFMGTGDVPVTSGYGAANALWVIDENVFAPRSPTQHEFIAWPPPGFVPYSVVFGRWSFFYPNADFSVATVTMQRDNQPIEVVLDAHINAGVNGENGVVWRPMGLDNRHEWEQPDADTIFTVTVHNMLIDGAPRTIPYVVKIFDPASSTSDPTTATVTSATQIGAPGSFFTVEGDNYNAAEELDIRINDLYLATVTTDEVGRFAVVLNTDGVDADVFKMSTVPVGRVTAAADAPLNSAYFTLDGGAAPQPPTPPQNGATPVELSVNDAFNPDTSIFLPTIRR